jgi:hypothetical protein
MNVASWNEPRGGWKQVLQIRYVPYQFPRKKNFFLLYLLDSFLFSSPSFVIIPILYYSSCYLSSPPLPVIHHWRVPRRIRTRATQSDEQNTTRQTSLCIGRHQSCQCIHMLSMITLAVSMSNVRYWRQIFLPNFCEWGMTIRVKKVKDGGGQTGSDKYPFGLFWKTHSTIVFPSAWC